MRPKCVPAHLKRDALLARFSRELRGKDLDRKARRLIVSRAVYEGKVDSAKSNQARYLPLNEGALAVLPDVVGAGLVVGGFSQDRFRDACEAIAEAAGVAPFTPHDLRRTFASHLLMKGVAMAKLQRALGHSSVTVTEKSYAYLAPSTLSDALALLDSR